MEEISLKKFAWKDFDVASSGRISTVGTSKVSKINDL